MQNRRIKVDIARTINMGNYNSLKVTAGLEQSISDDAELTEEYKNLWNTVNAEINRAIKAFEKQK
jgi:hypothetical protein